MLAATNFSGSESNAFGALTTAVYNVSVGIIEKIDKISGVQKTISSITEIIGLTTEIEKSIEAITHFEAKNDEDLAIINEKIMALRSFALNFDKVAEILSIKYKESSRVQKHLEKLVAAKEDIEDSIQTLHFIFFELRPNKEFQKASKNLSDAIEGL